MKFIKNKKLITCIILLAALVVIFLFFKNLAISQKDTTVIDVFEYTDLTIDGLSSKAIATLNLDTSTITNEKIKKLININNFSLNIESGIKNGDKLILTFKENSNLLKKYNLEIKSKTKEHLVNGLPELVYKSDDIPEAFIESKKNLFIDEIKKDYETSNKDILSKRYNELNVEFNDVRFTEDPKHGLSIDMSYILKHLNSYNKNLIPIIKEYRYVKKISDITTKNNVIVDYTVSQDITTISEDSLVTDISQVVNESLISFIELGKENIIDSFLSLGDKDISCNYLTAYLNPNTSEFKIIYSYKKYTNKINIDINTGEVSDRTKPSNYKDYVEGYTEIKVKELVVDNNNNIKNTKEDFLAGTPIPDLESYEASLRNNGFLKCPN